MTETVSEVPTHHINVVQYVESFLRKLFTKAIIFIRILTSQSPSNPGSYHNLSRVTINLAIYLNAIIIFCLYSTIEEHG